MEIRKAVHADLDEVMDIYEAARGIMRSSGNVNQWVNGYPQRDVLEQDINRGELYVAESDGKLCAVFMFTLRDDPTYAYVEDGAWPNDMPYGTIHRLGSSGKVRGVGGACIEFCKERIANVRADTHADNLIMQNLLKKHGFVRCCRIYVEDGTPREAFQFCG